MRFFAVLLVVFSVATVSAQGTTAHESDLGPELAKLNSQITRWRSALGVRAETVWKLSLPKSVLRSGAVTREDKSPSIGPAAPGDEVELAATAVFIAAGRRYRLSQQYATDMMRGLSFEAAFDEKHFQFVLKSLSQLRYSKNENRELLGLFLPILQIEPFQFLSDQKTGRNSLYVAWPDVFNEKLVRDRLHSGVVGSFKAEAGARPIVTFGGGEFDGQAVSYRLFVDGPDGQPSEVDYVDLNGKVRYELRFEYTKLSGGGGWWVPVKMATKAYGPNGGAVVTGIAETKKFDANAIFADDSFTIDLLTANTVYDMDAKKQLNGSAAPLPTGKHPSTQPGSLERDLDNHGAQPRKGE